MPIPDTVVFLLSRVLVALWLVGCSTSGDNGSAAADSDIADSDIADSDIADTTVGPDATGDEGVADAPASDSDATGEAPDADDPGDATDVTDDSQTSADVGAADADDVVPGDAGGDTGVGNDRFPLAVSPNGRHLVDGAGQPFLFHGEAAWSLMVQTTLAEAETYFADRAVVVFRSSSSI